MSIAEPDGGHDVIERVLFDYGWAIDSKQWQLLQTCFTEDCSVSYGNGHSPHPGGARRFSSRDELAAYLADTHGRLDGSLHMMSNVAVSLTSADVASARTYVRILLVLRGHVGGPVYESAGYYSDDLLRIEGHWRIRSRAYTRVWATGNADIIRPS